MSSSSTDRIEKRIALRAPVARVWRAIADAKEFGTWFGVDVDGPFVAGQEVTARIAPTKVDPEVARAQEPYAGTGFTFAVERVEEPRLFSFRWHPGAPDPKDDLSKEPKTLVTFQLTEVPEGTLLVITESGFDALPPSRRKKAFAQNEGGWEAQTLLIGKYLARPS